MDIQTRKIEFLKGFLKIQSEEMISLFEDLLKRAKKSEDEERLVSFTAEELNDRISKSEKDFQDGKYKTTAELLSKY